MGAYIAGPVASKMTADVAGNTSHAPIIPTTAPVQVAEILNGIGTEYGGLHNLFGGSLATTVTTDIGAATDSTVGRLGGLVPAIASAVAPGPTVANNPSNDSVNDPGITQSTTPGQVATDVANKPGGYANVATGQVNKAIADATAAIRGFLKL